MKLNLAAPAATADLDERRAAKQSVGAQLLDEVGAFCRRFIAYPDDGAAVAHTLWIAHTHAMHLWESTPRLFFESPEPGSGKTRALEVTELLVPRPIHAVNVSPAYLFRKVSDPNGLPTILYDEIDTVFGYKVKADHEDVRGLLNAGHRKGAITGRVKMVGKTAVPEELPAYCAVALAGLHDLPDTLTSRSVVIHMRRRTTNEVVEPFRPRIHEQEGHALRDRLAKWMKSVPAGDWPQLPPEITDRNADLWEALITIADQAGGDWPERARVTAVTSVTSERDQTGSLGVKLLTDLRTVFEDSGYSSMFTDEILRALHEMDGSPWSSIKGEPLNAVALARWLRGYGVTNTNKNVRRGDRSAKGYYRMDLVDPWRRYASPSPAEVTEVTEVTDLDDLALEKNIAYLEQRWREAVGE